MKAADLKERQKYQYRMSGLGLTPEVDSLTIESVYRGIVAYKTSYGKIYQQRATALAEQLTKMNAILVIKA